MKSRWLKPLAMAVLMAMVISPFLPYYQDHGGAVGAETYQETEPNSDMVRAQEVTSGMYIKGTLDQDADSEDWYKIFVPRGMVLNASVYMEDPGLNADLEVHYASVGGNMDLLWSKTDYRFETVCTLTIDDQFYYIRLFVHNGSGAYTFDVFVTEARVTGHGFIEEGYLYNNTNHVIDFYKVWLDHKVTSTDLVEVALEKTPIAPADRAWINLRIGTLYEWSVGIRWYDISWGNETYEHARAAASETGWYYIMVNAYNGSGHYKLDITISTVPTDGNDDAQDPALLYGPGLKAQGALHQALDHRDCYAVALGQGESLEAVLELGNSIIDDPTIFSITILEPDGDAVGEWTNYQDVGLDDTITANMGSAKMEGKYILLVEAKVAVVLWKPQDLTDEDGRGNYSLSINPSGHNTAPVAVSIPIRIAMAEDGQAEVDLSLYFTDEDLVEGDSLAYGLDTVTAFDGTEPLEVQFEGPLVTIAPQQDWSGSGTMEFMAQDLFGEEAGLTVFFNVDQVNDAPVALENYLRFTLAEGQESKAVDLDLVFYDPDIEYGDMLSYSVIDNGSLPAWVDCKGELVIGPVQGMGQEEAFSVMVTDLKGGSATIPVVVKVSRAEHAPVAYGWPEILSLDEDEATSLKLYDHFSDIDPEDTRLSFTWSTTKNIGALLDDDGVLSIVPVPDWSGTDYLYITATDHIGYSITIEIAVKVRPVGDAPVIDWASPPLGSELQLDGSGFTTFNLNISDRDPYDVLRFQWFMDGMLLPDHSGRLIALNEEDITNGTHTMELRVKDGYGLTEEGNWTLVVKRPAPVQVPRAPTPVETSVTGGSALALWFIFLVFLTEHGRFAIFKFLWVPLYTKIKKEEVLDQFIRGRIFGFIEHNPGVNYSQIKKKLSVGNGTLTHHLNMLERQNFIKAERDGIYKRFYPRNYAIDKDSVELSSIQRDIYVLAKTEPGISQKAIAARVGVSKRVISYHVRLLTEARILKVEKTGRRHALYALDK